MIKLSSSFVLQEVVDGDRWWITAEVRRAVQDLMNERHESVLQNIKLQEELHRLQHELTLAGQRHRDCERHLANTKAALTNMTTRANDTHTQLASAMEEYEKLESNYMLLDDDMERLEGLLAEKEQQLASMDAEGLDRLRQECAALKDRAQLAEFKLANIQYILSEPVAC
jgi:predicted  nucleic acid-binding Zn-ribbon protein